MLHQTPAHAVTPAAAEASEGVGCIKVPTRVGKCPLSLLRESGV